MLEIGQQASVDAICTDESILAFANATGDHNPIHFDDKIAQSAGFKRRIAHGMWTAGIISAILGTKLPGPGSIYLHQELNFKAPVYEGDVVTVTVRVISIDRSKINLETNCVNQEDQLLVSGNAIILLR